MTVDQAIELEQQLDETLAVLEDAEDGVVVERRIVWRDQPTARKGGLIRVESTKTEYPAGRPFRAHCAVLVEQGLVAFMERRTSSPGFTFDEKVAVRTVKSRAAHDG